MFCLLARVHAVYNRPATSAVVANRLVTYVFSVELPGFDPLITTGFTHISVQHNTLRGPAEDRFLRFRFFGSEQEFVEAQ
jgi:hypothetical protein